MWFKLLKFIGWKSVVTATPHVINKAHDFYQKKFKKTAGDEPSAATSDNALAVRIDKLEQLCLAQNKALSALAGEYKRLQRQLKKTWLVLIFLAAVAVIFVIFS